jgi:outer membrane protein
MKKQLIRAALYTLILGGVCTPGVVWSQAAKAPDAPHRIALIDMAQVFKKYKKFEIMREELKGKLQESEATFKQLATKLQQQQTELKNYKQGSDEYARLEKVLVEQTTKAEAFRKTQQRDLIRSEAQIYKTIYLEVSDAVQKFAQLRNYTLVLRFTADEESPSENPEEVMRSLNKQVVYYRQNDDVTRNIVRYLNSQYEKSAGAGVGSSNEAGAPARQ